MIPLRYLLVAVGNLYAGTMRGLYRSSDGGDTWIRNEDIGSGATDIVRDHDGTLYVAANRGRFRSLDGGLTWNQVGQFGPYAGLLIRDDRDRLITTKEGVLLAGDIRGTLYRSSDVGNTWEEMTSWTAFRR